MFHIIKTEYIGDSCISFVFSKKINREINTHLLTVYRNLQKSDSFKDIEILDMISTYGSLAFHFDPLFTDIFSIEKVLKEKIEIAITSQESVSITTVTHTIPVKYKGMDLERIAECHNLSVGDVISKHTKPVYTVAMVGFKPHFPYLIGLDDDLKTDRLDNPRLKIPAGSVAIGGEQTGIYPADSPGGWNILGSTDPRLLLKIKPGDEVCFHEE